MKNFLLMLGVILLGACTTPVSDEIYHPWGHREDNPPKYDVIDCQIEDRNLISKLALIYTEAPREDLDIEPDVDSARCYWDEASRRTIIAFDFIAADDVGVAFVLDQEQRVVEKFLISTFSNTRFFYHEVTNLKPAPRQTAGPARNGGRNS